LGIPETEESRGADGASISLLSGRHTIRGSSMYGEVPIVSVGSRVTIRDSAGEDTFRIVNDEFADPTGRRWISEGSPMARALIGHRPGEVVRVRAPSGVQAVTLLAVEAVSEP